ncbi:MAG: PD-(D/E)XK nuclease family protein [Pirellulaceae bacterium]|nr:PD-(D/E)XK nuclease family protein [Pirellulaceae bacterium]
MQQVFLGLDGPVLPRVADYLFRQAARGPADLSDLLVVVPGRGAQRRLLELLVERSEGVEGRFHPPLVCTPGRLPEELYEPRRPFADDLVQRLVWVRALREVGGRWLEPLVPALPEASDMARWLELADMLRRLHTELAADGLDFQKVGERGAAISGFNESARWEALARVQEIYLAQLDALGLWDLQTARLKAIEYGECRTQRRVVLAGTVDMNLALRQMVDRVADRVTALVFAPEAWRERFDQHGCLRPAAWREVTLELPETCVSVVDRPADQAQEVARQVALLEGRYRADELTIGVPNEGLVPDVCRVLRQVGVPARWGPGSPILQTGPCRLLAAVADVLRGERASDVAALVRHPDIARWLQRQGVRGDWLTELDGYYQQYLPARLTGEWAGQDSDWPALKQAWKLLAGLLEPLRSGPGGPPAQPQPAQPQPAQSQPAQSQPARPLSAWSGPLLELLREIYGGRTCHLDDAVDRGVLRACQALVEALRSQEELPAELALELPVEQAVQLTLERISGQRVPPPDDPDAVEVLGWLELPWDDTPVLIVTGMNEGVVPEAVNADLFLPNALRAGLQLEDNDRRYARDAYSLSVLLATRREIRLIVGRRTAEGDPLLPSRLLLAAAGETVARRVRQYLRPNGAPPPPVPDGWRETHRLADFPVPRPEPLPDPLTRLSVTDFRSYLACPYRFYLQRVLRLEPLRDDAEELDGGAFGTLLHEVLKQFGQGPKRDELSADAIRAELDELLDRYVPQFFVGPVRTTVLVQIEQLRLRLHAFAERQAAWAGSGWRIEHTEVPQPGGPGGELLVDGQPLELRGRIDRIDVHRETGERVILDYKSSDSGLQPDQTHRRGGQWVDLQLPLYRHLARGLELAGQPRLGYVLLPKDPAGGGFFLAEWTAEELQEADEVAWQVVRAVRQQRFWPPVLPPPDFSESVAPICQDGVFDNWLQRQAREAAAVGTLVERLSSIALPAQRHERETTAAETERGT